MPSYMTIELKQLHFYSHHGLFPEEQLTGNDFEVNLSVSYQSGETVISKMENTINYVRLYELVKERMSVPANLLETVAMDITETIKRNFDPVISVDISVYKLHPPIGSFQGQVGIRYHKDF